MYYIIVKSLKIALSSLQRKKTYILLLFYIELATLRVGLSGRKVELERALLTAFKIIHQDRLAKGTR